MSYLGRPPSVPAGTRVVYEFVATEGQTVFSGEDEYGRILSYDPGYVNLFVNGRFLSGLDFDALDGSQVTIKVALPANTVVQVEAFGTFAIADVYPKADIDNLFYKKTTVDSLIKDSYAYRNVINIVDGSEINPNNIGALLRCSNNTNSTIAIPPATSGYNGKWLGYTVYNYSQKIITITGTPNSNSIPCTFLVGGDVGIGSGLTNIVLYPGESIELIPEPSSSTYNVYDVMGTGVLKYMSSNYNLDSGNSRKVVRLGNGWMLQSQLVTLTTKNALSGITGNEFSGVATFPIAFASAPVVWTSMMDVSTGYNIDVSHHGSANTTTVAIYAACAGTGVQPSSVDVLVYSLGK